MTINNSNIIILSVLSCITLNSQELDSLSISKPDILPSTCFTSENTLSYNTYSIKELNISNATPLLNETLINEYNILATFANKILIENVSIDPEIQNIIDEHFWDML